MRGTRAAAVVCLLGAACLAAPPDPAEPVSLEARYDGGGRSRAAAVSIGPDGAATVVVRTIGRQPGADRVEISIGLSAEDIDDLRARVGKSRFFEEWADSEEEVREWPGWDVTVFLGAREKRRAGLGRQPEFAPLAQYLSRFVAQAEATERVRRGEALQVAEEFLGADAAARIVRPSALAAELVPVLARVAAGATRPNEAREAARHLARLAEPADGAARLAEILAHTQGERRDAVLAAWALEMKRSGRTAHRRAFAPIALDEVRRPWDGWRRASDVQQSAMCAVLGFAFLSGAPGAPDAVAAK